ncbi:putative MFS-type transporter YtbD [Trichinella spiralis]|uniref:MFS-type transporter YtbD n=1 Tax=Trichinella spiralis TaxID=6334 RepID=A0ABR3KWG3_TRISP
MSRCSTSNSNNNSNSSSSSSGGVVLAKRNFSAFSHGTILIKCKLKINYKFVADYLLIQWIVCEGKKLIGSLVNIRSV